jgi:hypothetical protein
MASKDFIIRTIEQLAAYLWSIIFNKKIKNYEYALETIEEAYNGLLNSTGNTIKKLEFNEIIGSNTKDNILNIDNIEIIANLLFEEADIIEQKDGLNNISQEYYQKTVLLFLKMFEETGKQEHKNKIEEIVSKVSNYEITDEVKYSLYKYFEKIGLYGKAEDYLYELFENRCFNIKNELQLFYKRLLEKDDSILQKGNLPRNEIIEAMSILDKRGEK